MGWTAEEMLTQIVGLLWTGALAATPLVILVGVACRWQKLRPATRHVLWLAALLSFVTPVIGASLWRAPWFRSEHMLSAVDAVLADEKEGGVRDPKAVVSKAMPRPVLTPKPVLEREHRPVGSATDGRVPRARSVRTQEPLAVLVPELAVSMEPAGEPARLDVAELARSERVDHAHRVEWDAPGVTTAPAASPRVVEQVDDRSRKPAAVEPAAVGPGSLSGAVASVRPEDAGEVGGIAGAPRDVRVWAERLLGVRDALRDLPPIPASVWFAGTGLILTLCLWRTAMAGLWIRRARPANDEVQVTVRRIGEALGLKRVPTAVFVDGAVSPMIWCGLKPRLVLPAGLWKSLGEDSRRAVIVHELAHVRRKDHLVCWLEAAVGAVYWWHPAVWWARRRLHDEAEASCDAWVTTLFPSDRRAYASALVVAKSYLGPRDMSGGRWLGMASGSAKRLARRITMVMTERTAPKMSMVGMSVAALVVAAGTFVTPGLACPPDKVETAKAMGKGTKALNLKTTVKTVDGSQVLVVETTPGEPVKAGDTKATGEVRFFGEAPALDAMRAEEPGSQGGKPAKATKPAKAANKGMGVMVAPGSPTPPKPPAAPRVMTTMPNGQLFMHAPGAAHAQNSPHGLQGTAVVTDHEKLKEGRKAKSYHLPQGKLQCFYSLMSRQDVPILVEMETNSIKIWGTDAEHEVFGGFVGIIGKGENHAGQGMHFYTPEKFPGTFNGKEFMKMNGQEDAKHASERYRQSLKSFESLRGQLERDADKAREQAEQDRERAEEMREMAEELRGRSRQLKQNEDRAAMEAAIGSLRTRSQTLTEQSRATEDRLRAIEAQLREIEAKAERIEERLGDLDEGMEEIIDDEVILTPDDLSPIEIDMDEIEEIDAPEIDMDDASPEIIDDAEAEAAVPAMPSLSPIAPMPTATPALPPVAIAPTTPTSPTAPISPTPAIAPTTPAPSMAPVAPGAPAATPAVPTPAPASAGR